MCSNLYWLITKILLPGKDKFLTQINRKNIDAMENGIGWHHQYAHLPYLLAFLLVAFVLGLNEAIRWLN
jgi:hypothetical protein